MTARGRALYGIRGCKGLKPVSAIMLIAVTGLKVLVQLNSWGGAPDESDRLFSLQVASAF